MFLGAEPNSKMGSPVLGLCKVTLGGILPAMTANSLPAGDQATACNGPSLVGAVVSAPPLPRSAPTHVADPSIGLALRVDHERPPAAVVQDDGIFDAEFIIRQFTQRPF